MATKIADFIKDHDLDSVDIDWEYPGAPDLPTFNPGTEEDGLNYLVFLVVLKNLLPGKSVAITTPASYWYLKQFLIEGCETGNCLRSQVNLTETRQSLVMITKAGVPGNKVVVGVTSYGRSFKMAQPGCYNPDCTFTGDRLSSHVIKGWCTGTAGYLVDAEITEILEDSSRVTCYFINLSSHSNILVYGKTKWVGYISTSIKSARTTLYASWGLGGISDWASDLQSFHAAPKPNPDWVYMKSKIAANLDPFIDETRNGNWTNFNCDDDNVKYLMRAYPED
ncbi:uncharacterized protein APUU_10107S [Aspergillus puulaauensis]|uniref:GH18 domain-containing protein n=1 Tax=Aspergillus puulaauensis TaxID=1220207 RepID=A0A7R7XAV6_9EURO|nr:uncharacterized protein APUU_10107S [Aspergillus puulaauensis]BCS17279.1 hypothetical protein APUU_10107S [Aspergillus puulaauensis]